MPTKKQPRRKLPQKTHYNVTEAAKKLGVSRNAVLEAIRTGRLEAEKDKVVTVIKGYLIPRKALQNYRVSLSHQQAGKKNQ